MATVGDLQGMVKMNWLERRSVNKMTEKRTERNISILENNANHLKI